MRWLITFKTASKRKFGIAKQAILYAEKVDEVVEYFKEKYPKYTLLQINGLDDGSLLDPWKPYPTGEWGKGVYKKGE